MSLWDRDTIDIIALRKNGEDYDLIIWDDGKIKDELKRYDLIMEKLTSYVNYVISGQFYKENPKAEGKDVRCVVVCKRPANETMLKITGVKPKDHPALQLPVVVMDEDEYLGVRPKRPWWKFSRT